MSRSSPPDSWFENCGLDARALWAVRVLDAWAVGKRAIEWAMADCDGSFCCTLTITNGGPIERTDYYAATSDAARLAAAEAVFPNLDADVRATLGERP